MELDEMYSQLSAVRDAYHTLCKQTGSLPYPRKLKTARRIVIDTETTGLNSHDDELLQVSILDADTSEILINKYFRPFFHREWPDAEAVNHISPDMVMNKPYFATAVPELNQIMRSAETIIGYNTSFDVSFLRAYGVCIEDKEYIDVMKNYAQNYGEYDEEKGRYRWCKLTECAAALGYNWGEEQAHDSLADCRATMYCWAHLL